MEDPIPPFDDPALKAAMHAALSGERAPRELHDRIDAAMRAEAQMARRRTLYLAIAASVAVFLGVGALLLWPSSEKPAPAWFADAMIATHDQCSTLADHHLVKDVNDADHAALRARYAQTLGHPALVAMVDEGWQFEGAGQCEIAKVPAAHLLFTRDGQTLSIFSITSRLLYQDSSQRNATYAQTQNGHQIAGFSAGGAVHCLVADSPRGNLNLRQVIRLRDRLRKAAKDLRS